MREASASRAPAPTTATIPPPSGWKAFSAGRSEGAGCVGGGKGGRHRERGEQLRLVRIGRRGAERLLGAGHRDVGGEQRCGREDDVSHAGSFLDTVGGDL